MSVSPLETWEACSLPVVIPSEWTSSTARAGLRVMARLAAQLAAAQAQLVTVMRAGRDTRASIVRATGMSGRDATRAEQVAKVVERLPEAAEALGSGAVSAGHVALLHQVHDGAAAKELLTVAAGQTADDFAATVQRHLLDAEADSVAARQRAARTVTFGRADDGGMLIRAVLPHLDGERVKAAIEARCDQAWREAHPDRADVAGGHGDEPRHRRMADALVELVTGGATAGVRTGVVVVVDEASMTADVAGAGPMSRDVLADVVMDARTDLWAAVRSMNGAILSFGRSRRFATAIQKLALVARDGGTCSWPGCRQPWSRCDADHQVDWDDNGTTDLPNLRLLCRLHHPQRHETGLEPDDPDPPELIDDA